MDFNKSMTIELSGQETATVIAGLLELPGKVAYDLLKKFEAVQAAQVAENSKVPGPDLKMVSAG